MSISSKIRTLYQRPHLLHRYLFKNSDIRKGSQYIQDVGLHDLLVSGHEDEYKFQPFDLYNIHSLIRKRKPLIVAEFGTGWSTIAIAHALHLNHKDDPSHKPHLYTTDAAEKWLENVNNKLPSSLKAYVTLRYSP